jgi:hypothetical protein
MVDPIPVEVVAEAGGWSVLIPGFPVAVDAATLDEAFDELVDALREYADDWRDHLFDAPGHRERRDIVRLIVLSDDRQLRARLLGSARDASTSGGPT